jgi:AraC family transcriptional regulator
MGNPDSTLIGPYETGRWIPVSPILASRPGQWNGLDLTSQGHAPWSGYVPPLRSHLVTIFLKPGWVRRQMTGPWLSSEMRANEIVFIPRATGSEWEWKDQLRNIHLHISDDYLSRIAYDVFGRHSDNLELVDRLSIPDEMIASSLKLLENEARGGGIGEHVFADAIGTQLCVHLLRNYTSLSRARAIKASALDGKTARKIVEYIEGNLRNRLDIKTLAAIAEQSPYHFARVFKQYFETTPHEFVMNRRVEQARILIMQGNHPLKRIAAECGFCDQSHMSHAFKARFGVPPGQFALLA